MNVPQLQMILAVDNPQSILQPNSSAVPNGVQEGSSSCGLQLPATFKDNQTMLCAKLRYFKDLHNSRRLKCQFCDFPGSTVCLASTCQDVTCYKHTDSCLCKSSFMVDLASSAMVCKQCHQTASQHIGGTGAPSLSTLTDVLVSSSARLPALPSLTTSLLLCQSNGFYSSSNSEQGSIPRRLLNLGNTCYINASLQCLANCRPTVRYMRKCSSMFRHLTNNPNLNAKQQRLSRVVLGYAALLSHLRPTRVAAGGGLCALSLSPAAFLREFAAANPTFRLFVQQDAQEFVRLLLDNLHDGLKELPAASPSNPKPSTSSASSVVSQTFGGHLVSKIRCGRCGNVSKTADEFLDVSLSIVAASQDVNGNPISSGGTFWDLLKWSTPAVSLEECLRQFCRAELLSGSERCVCDRCKQRTDSAKTLSLRAPLPDVVLLHLKRFRFDSFFGSKISTQVQFPLDSLDLAPYCDAESLEKHARTVTTFRCVGVIRHLGGFGGGHYVAYVRDRHSGRWFECDDSSIREVPRETVQSTEAYMLFYQKMQPHAATVAQAKKKTREWHRALIAAVNSSSSASAAAAAAAASLSSSSLADGKPLESTQILNEPYVYIFADAYNALVTMAELPLSVRLAPPSCPHGITHVSALDREKLVPISLCSWRLFSALLASDALQPAYTIGQCSLCEKLRLECTARRQAEREKILSLDRGYLRQGECWYIISANWLNNWHDYVGDTTGTIEPPGPISNAADLLLPSDQKTPKPKLVKRDDYRGVVKEVWDHFQSIYGGGPPIVRRTLDLYAVDNVVR